MLIPLKIQKALECFEKNLDIVEYSIERGVFTTEYDIKLRNGKEFTFKKNGNLKK